MRLEDLKMCFCGRREDSFLEIARITQLEELTLCGCALLLLDLSPLYTFHEVMNTFDYDTLSDESDSDDSDPEVSSKASPVDKRESWLPEEDENVPTARPTADHVRNFIVLLAVSINTLSSYMIILDNYPG